MTADADLLSGPVPAEGDVSSAAPSEEAIYRTLHAAITERRLPAGMRLVEDQLARLFCVSRARVRAVLQMLARDRMVTLQKNRGAFVSYPSVAEAREVFQARRLIESALIREAAVIAVQKGVDVLDRHVEQERQAARRNDRRESIRLSGDFHLLIAELVGNSTLTGYLEELIARTSLVIAIYEGRAGAGDDCGPDAHYRIVRALSIGDADQAARLMQEHLVEVEAHLDLARDLSGQKVDFTAVFG
jgi:DNA-binding GntR family transcriptional regulator